MKNLASQFGKIVYCCLQRKFDVSGCKTNREEGASVHCLVYRQDLFQQTVIHRVETRQTSSAARGIN